MTPLDVQRLLTAAKYYDKGLDGDWGAESRKAADKVLRARSKELPSGWIEWSAKRQMIATGQLILTHAGFPCGAIDGYAGHLTMDALRAWNFQQAHGQPEVIPVEVIRPKPGYTFPHQSGVTVFYGVPGPAIERQLVSVPLPFPMRIDWNLDEKVRSIRLHKKCASSAQLAIEQSVAHYGEDRWRRLGLDRFAGSYNHRKMRGGSAWSMHAYGCAVDFYAAPNGLTMRCPQALFCGEEYKAFFDIWEAQGWTSLGRAIGRDWMHLQAANIG